MKTTKEMIEVMTHYENGGEIEILYPNEGWKDCPKPSWNWRDYDYRIKQKPKYIEGKYYKCWEKGFEPIIAIYKNGFFKNGSISINNEETFNKIEPFEPEQKKYGLWVATDEDDIQYVYVGKRPKRLTESWQDIRYGCIELSNKIFPNQTWEDEPIEI